MTKVEVLRAILRPVIRFSVKNSITLNDLLEAAKTLFVDVIADELSKAQEKVTVSRISVVAGMTRREVTRIYRENEISESSPSLPLRILVQWEQDERFCGKNKKPKVLTYRGENNQFHELVRSISQDINPATVLKELDRIGAVKYVGQGIKLNKIIGFHTDKPDRALNLLYRDVETIGRAVEENVFEAHEIRNLHLRTEFDNIFIEDLPKARRWLLAQGTAFHKKIRDYLAKHDKDMNPNEKKKGGGIVVLGAYSWTGTEPVQE